MLFTSTDRLRAIRRPITVALMAPPSRMVSALAWANRLKDGRIERGEGYYLAVAIRSMTFDVYCWSGKEPAPYAEMATPAEMIAAGWWFMERDIADQLLYVRDGILQTDPFSRDDYLVEAAAVICDWSPSEDDARLAPTFDRLRRDLEERAAKYWSGASAQQGFDEAPPEG